MQVTNYFLPAASTLTEDNRINLLGGAKHHDCQCFIELKNFIRQTLPKNLAVLLESSAETPGRPRTSLSPTEWVDLPERAGGEQ